MKKEKEILAYKIEDGVAPTIDVNGVISLRPPMKLELKEREKLSLKLGVSFNLPVVIYESGFLARNGLRLNNNATLFMPNNDVVLHLEAVSNVLIETVDVLAFAIAVNTTFSLEKKS